MPSTSFYPPLSNILPLGYLPSELSSVQQGLTEIFDNLFYKNLQIQRSSSGDAGFYKLILLSYTRIGFEIGGADGMAFLLNPSFTSGGMTEVPVSFSYRWAILRYLSDFDMAKFASTPKEFFDLLLKIAGLNQFDLVNEAIAVLIDDADPIQKFVDDFATNHSPDTLTRNTGLSDPDQIADLIDQLVTLGYDPFELIYEDYIIPGETELTGLGETVLTNLTSIFQSFIGSFTEKNLLDLLVPQFSASIDDINVGIEFPRSVLKPVDSANNVIEDDSVKSLLTFDIGKVGFSTSGGFTFTGNYSNIRFTKSEILGTGMILELNGVKLDLSRTTNIPEAIADGRPTDFIGVYVLDGSISLPATWNHDVSGSTAALKVRNMLAGTGGLSGTISLEAKTAGDPSPVVKAKLGGGFEVTLDTFSIEFKQSAIVDTAIAGTLKIPGFTDQTGAPAVINISAQIGREGFSITADVEHGIDFLQIAGVLKFTVSSLTIGQKNDKFFIAISGNLRFLDQGGTIGDFLPEDIDIKKLVIWQDGSFEFEGGSIVLPSSVNLSIGPVKLAISNIHLGSHEQLLNQVNRKYLFFGFDGGIKLGAAGVDARGDGIKFYFTVDNNGADKRLHTFVRIQGIGIDLVIPGGASKESATLLLSGYLSMKDAASPGADTATEYTGSVTFSLPKMHMAGSAGMRLNPAKSAWVVDVGLELSTPILLGTTGLGIYGFRGLVGQRYVASKKAAINDPSRDPDTVSWWEYYKAKVPPENHEGIQLGKFEQKDGFSVGAGASIATAGDSGHVFSSKLFLLLSLPEVFLLQGQASILSERIGLDTTTDPPFFALIAIDTTSVEAAFGVHYRLPDPGGEILSVDGLMEMKFFFNNASAWYLNIGRDQPTDKRLQARLFTLFNAYAYLMLSSRGIKAGAGASWELKKKFGPASVELGAYLDTGGRISFRPFQIGAFIRIGGYARIKVFRFGFGFDVSVSLAAEAPKPFVVTGELTINISTPWPFPDVKVHIELTWRFNNDLNLDEVFVLAADHYDNTSLFATDDKQPAKALNVLTGEPFKLNFLNQSFPRKGSNSSSIPGPTQVGGSNWIESFDNHVVPMDSFIDIEFTRPVLPDSSSASIQKLGGLTGGAEYKELLPPDKARSEQVIHEFRIRNVSILYWNNGSWQPFDMYWAHTPLKDVAKVDPSAFAKAKYGYWQMTEPNRYTKLRLLAQDPVSYLTQGSGTKALESLGFPGGVLLCADEVITLNCLSWNGLQASTVPYFPADRVRFDRRLLFRSDGADAILEALPNIFVLTPSVRFNGGKKLEIFFREPVNRLELRLSTLGSSVTIDYYQRTTVDASVVQTDPIGHWSIGTQDPPRPDRYGTAVSSVTKTFLQLLDPVVYDSPTAPIWKVVITAPTCGSTTIDNSYWQQLIGELQTRRATLQSNYDQAVSDYNAAKTLCDNAKACDTYCASCCGQCHCSSKALCDESDRLHAIVQDLLGRLNAIDGLLGGIGGSGGGYPTGFIACSTYLHQVCWTTKQEYDFNLTIPPSGTVTQTIQDMFDGLRKVIQPIWRPDTCYAIQVETEDAITGVGGISPYVKYFTFGFKTAGPVGHFHRYKTSSGTEVVRSDYAALAALDRADEYKLASLKPYIDYMRSYPNADGNILNAKPLFYRDPELLIFYRVPYVVEMYNDWDKYNTLPKVSSRLQVVIKDPVDLGKTPLLSPATVAWVSDPNPHQEEDIKTINNLVINGINCVLITDPVKRPSMYTRAKPVAKESLQPLKLYAAIYNAIYNGDTQEVHRYVFQTSRYADFAEQIGSWVLKDDGTNQTRAVFTISATFDLTDAPAIVQGTSTNATLAAQFQDTYDRLIDGALKVGTVVNGGSLDAAETTEFNILVNTTTGNVIGILVRSPEPFNDPKIPGAVLATSGKEALAVVNQVASTGALDSSYTIMHSKDRSRIFVTNSSMNIPRGDLKFTFRYLEFDGAAYGVADEQTVKITLE